MTSLIDTTEKRTISIILTVLLGLIFEVCTTYYIFYRNVKKYEKE